MWKYVLDVYKRQTRLSLLYILDVLYTCYFELDYDYFLQKKLEYYQVIRENSEKW